MTTNKDAILTLCLPLIQAFVEMGNLAALGELGLNAGRKRGALMPFLLVDLDVGRARLGERPPRFDQGPTVGHVVGCLYGIGDTPQDRLNTTAGHIPLTMDAQRMRHVEAGAGRWRQSGDLTGRAFVPIRRRRLQPGTAAN